MEFQTPVGPSGEVEQGLWRFLRPARDALAELCDEQLRFLIVNELPGWQDAYKELFIERYGGVVQEVVRRFGPHRLGLKEPEDVHGELLEYLRGRQGTWRHLRSWNPQKGPFGPWLWKVVRNLCYDLAKRAARESGNAISLDKPRRGRDGSETAWGDSIPYPSATPEQQVVEKVMDELIDACLQKSLEQLGQDDEESWFILMRSFFDGLKDGEIAKILGVARETVNRKKQKAIRKLNAYVNACLEGAP